MIKKLLANDILIKSILTMFVQGLGQLTAFFSAILLARYFEVSQYGQYMFGVTAATIIAVIATLGADGILARSWGWSENTGSKRSHEIFCIQNWFFKKGLLMICIALILTALYFILMNQTPNWIEVFAFLFVIPFFIANLLQSFFIANRKVVYANLIQFFMRIIMLAIIVVFFSYGLHAPEILVCLMFISISVYMLILWGKMSFKHGLHSLKPKGSNLSFMLLKWGNLLLAQVDIVLLKFFSTNENIAYYAVALQLSALVVFVLNAVSSNILSQVANDYKYLSHEKFQHKITSYTRIIVSLSAIVIIALISSGYWITLLYGEAYTAAYYLFCVLMIGQIVNVLCGSVFTILNMSGFEKTTCRVFYVALMINIVLGIILIPFYQAYGVAIASVIAMMYWNIYLLVIVITKLKINPTIFSFLTAKR